MKEILAKLVEGKDLTKEEAMKAQELILTGQATEAQIACFLTALRMKGETLDEITGLAAVLRNKAKYDQSEGKGLCRFCRYRRRLYLFV